MTVTNDTNDSHNLLGSSGDDTINGNGGDDTIQGSAGSDSLNGGTGNDLFSLDFLTPGIGSILDGGADSDTVSAIGAHLAGVTFSNVELLVTGSQYVYMNSGQVAAFPLIQASASDAISPVYVALTDSGTVDFSTNAAQGISVYTYSGGDTVTTGAGSDTITASGNSGFADGYTFSAGGSADRLVLDYLDFGVGTIDGGAGTDTISANYSDISALTISSVEVLEVGGAFTTMKAAQAGLFTSIVYSAADSTMPVVIALSDSGTADFSTNAPQGIYVHGIDGGDTITTGAGNDTLEGGTGANVFHGGGGNDYLVIAYHTPPGGTLDGGAGSADTLVAAGSDLSAVTLTGIEILETGSTYTSLKTGQLAGLTSIQQDDLDTTDPVAILLTDTGVADFGSLAPQGIYAVAALTGDTIRGGGSADTLIGRDGNDVLNGRAGPDIMIGGAGRDLFYVDNASDVVNEGANEGVDTVIASLSYALTGAQSIDRFFTSDQSGTGAMNLTGNGFAQRIEGNNGVNILNGRGGGDTLVGHVGNDLYYVTSVTDRVIETTGEGSDTVFTASNFRLGGDQSVELLATTARAGTGALTLIGSSIAQRIDGNYGDNMLDGGGGGDTLYGFAGNDKYIVRESGDKAFETAGQGTDSVFATLSYTLSAGQSIEIFATTSRLGVDAIDLTGNEQAQRIDGNYGDNALNGGGGNDTLYGFDGADRLTGGAGHDVMAGGAGSDIFLFAAAADSTGLSRDLIQSIDLSQDKFHVSTAPTLIDTMVTHGKLTTSNFDGDLASAVGADQLGIQHAVLFDPDDGDLNVAHHIFLVVDANGVAGYQAGQDYVVELQNATGTLTVGDFT